MIDDIKYFHPPLPKGSAWWGRKNGYRMHPDYVQYADWQTENSLWDNYESVEESFTSCEASILGNPTAPCDNIKDVLKANNPNGGASYLNAIDKSWNPPLWWMGTVARSVKQKYYWE